MSEIKGDQGGEDPMSSEELGRESEVTTSSPADGASGPEPELDGDGEVVYAGQAASASPASPASPSYEWQGVKDYARSLGVDLPYQDDGSALAGLLDAYKSRQQRDWYAEYGQRLAPYADQVQGWLEWQRQQQAAAQHHQAQQRQAWQPPEWNPDWVKMVERDPETGIVRSKAGYDPRIADRVMEYAKWRDTFLENPGQVLGPMVEGRARELIAEEFGNQRQHYVAEQLVNQNSTWMFQVDGNGYPVLHPDGSRALSPAGALYARAVNDIWNSGVRDVNRCHQLARGQVENAVIRQQWLMQQQAASQSGGTQQAAVANGQVQPSVGGSATRPSVSPKRGPQSQAGMSLRERLQARASHIPDEDV